MRGRKLSIQVFRLATQLSNVTDAIKLHLQQRSVEWPAMILIQQPSTQQSRHDSYCKLVYCRSIELEMWESFNSAIKAVGE